MVNLYSKRSWLASLFLVVLATACGGDSDESGATNKADWEKKHGAVVNAVSLDVDLANGGLDRGDRPVILSSCIQLQEDMTDARRSVPVPDPNVDGALRAAFDSIDTAVTTCIEGGRVASDARIVEKAQAEMKDARAKLDAAQAAVKAWQ